jgi:hypothetical protein
VIAVNRRPPSGTTGAQVRDSHSIVTIGGRSVQPLRPVASRPQYFPSTSGQSTSGQGRQAVPSRPSYQGAASTGQRPVTNFVPGGSHQTNTPTARPFGGGQTAPSQHAPAYSRPSSGGGSSSPSHSSGGGGGGNSGGGGGSHSSGGSGGSTHR